MSSLHRTLSGGLAVEDGDSGATVDAAGDAFSWGPRGALLLSELEAAGARVPTGPAPTAVVLNDGGGLMPAARERLAEDGISVPTASADPSVERQAQEARELIFGGRSPGERAAIEETAARLDPRRRSPETAEAIDDTRERLAPRRAGEPAARSAPSDPDGWEGVDAELASAREQLGDAGTLRRPAPAAERPQRPTRGEGWQLLGGGRRATRPRQALGAIAGTSAAQLRAMAASDDAGERARIRNAVNSWPELAPLLGTRLMRALKEDQR